MAKCVACGKFLGPAGAATCCVCSSLCHKACVSLPESAPVSKSWVCPECKTRTRKGDNTPVRPQATQDTGARADSQHMAARAPSAGASPVALELQDVHQELAEWMKEMRDFRREMAEFRATIVGLSSRLDSFEQRLEVVERGRDVPSPEVADLRCRVVLLQQELNERDQDALLSDMEIGHLPEQKGENVVHTVTVLAAKLGVTLDERDIVFAERVGVAQGAGAAGEAPRDRRVVVRLARRHLRDQMLQAARVRRTLSAADAGHDTARRIFVNERLTRVNRQLFHRVREECRRLQWRYSWTRRGRVYARQSDGKQAYPIKSESDLQRVFGLESV